MNCLLQTIALTNGLHGAGIGRSGTLTCSNAGAEKETERNCALEAVVCVHVDVAMKEV